MQISRRFLFSKRNRSRSRKSYRSRGQDADEAIPFLLAEPFSLFWGNIFYMMIASNSGLSITDRFNSSKNYHWRHLCALLATPWHEWVSSIKEKGWWSMLFWSWLVLLIWSTKQQVKFNRHDEFQLKILIWSMSRINFRRWMVVIPEPKRRRLRRSEW